MEHELDFKSDFETINEKILNVIHLVISVMFFPALLSSVSRILNTGFKYLYIFHIVMFIFIWTLYFLKGKVKFKYRTVLFITILIMISIPGIPNTGMKGEWGMIMILYTFVIALFYGRKAGFISVICTFFSIIILSYFFLPTFYSNAWQGFFESGDLIQLIFKTIMVVIVSMVIVFAISKYREYFISNLHNLLVSKHKLKESETKFKKLSNLTFEGILIHDKGIAIDMNHSFANMFGYTHEELLGKNIIKLLIPEEHHETIAENIVKNYALPYEIEGIKKDGSILPIELETRYIGTDQENSTIRVAAIRDITERKKSQNKLLETNMDLQANIEEARAANEELKATTDALQDSFLELELAKEEAEKNATKFTNLFQNSPTSLWEEDFTEILDLLKNLRQQGISNYKEYLLNQPDIVKECSQKMKTLDVNETTLKILKAPSKEYLLNNIDKILNKKSYAFFIDELVAILQNKKEFSGETELIRFDGKVITVLSKMFITEEEGKIITAATDITKRKLAEKELMIAKKKAEESDQLKTEFIQNMSHEIRTPLNGILGFSNLLGMDRNLNDKGKKYISIIQNSGNQLVNIIDDILEISKLAAKQVVIQNEKVCLNKLLNELFYIFESKANDTKVQFHFKKEVSDKESTIFTDVTKLNKILGNLLENAFKFTKEGLIEFGYYLTETNDHSSSYEKIIQIYVKDTGVGIHSGKQQTIFKRFSQEEKDLSRNVGGLGLGLSIAQENAELLSGTISVKSEKGKGSTFTVTIPYILAN